VKNGLRVLVVLAALLVPFWACAQFEEEDPFEAGRKLFEQQKYAEALAKFQETLKWVPEDPLVLSWIGACHVSLSQFPEAEKALKAAIDNGGNSYKFFELLTVSQVRQAKWDDALATIKRYRETATADEVQQNLDKLRAVESALHLEKRVACLRLDPPDKDCADAEAETAWALGAQDPAQSAQFAQIWLARGASETDPARRDAMYARAEAASRAWLAAAPAPDSARAKASLGTALVRQKKLDEALTVLEEAIQADPLNCALRGEVTRVHLAREDFPAAKAAATEMIACRSDDPQGWLFRAMAEHGLENCPGVLKDGAEYMKRAPGKDEPKFVTYCKQVLDWKKAEDERKKQLDEYKKWVQQQLESGPEL
jgi:tetratricopeptide (TPR) repeat protein